jgi:hypothetical protein
MRGAIFYSFLIVAVSVFLWLLPVTSAAYDFRTDLKEDNFTVDTAVGVTTGNVTLFKYIYDDDYSTLDITSDDSDDIPSFSTYNATTRLVTFTGLSANNSRTITCEYDVDALEGNDALDTLMDHIPWIYMLMVSVLPVAGIAAIWIGRT